MPRELDNGPLNASRTFASAFRWIEKEDTMVGNLGLMLLIVLFGFAVLIYFLLKTRKSFLAKNLQIKPDFIWQTIANRSAEHGLQRSNLIYGVYQDKTTSVAQLIIKDSTGAVLGQIDYPLGMREFKLSLSEIYSIQYPYTWRRSAHLLRANGELVASFERLPFSYTKHKIVMPGVGTLLSRRPKFNFKYPFDYCLNGKVVGITQAISTSREVGQIAVFSSEIPLISRIFTLAICARGL